MTDHIRAESLKLVRRPATWALLAIALCLSVTFTYLIPYAGYAGGTGGPRADRGLDALLPGQLVGNSIGGLPVFLGSLMLILGVLAAGGEYAWGTWKTVLTQDPARLRVYAAKLVTICLAALPVSSPSSPPARRPACSSPSPRTGRSTGPAWPTWRPGSAPAG